MRPERFRSGNLGVYDSQKLAAMSFNEAGAVPLRKSLAVNGLPAPYNQLQ